MSSWNTTTKIFFRLGFIYFVLYVFPFPIGSIPFTELIRAHYYNAWLGPTNWIGKNILSIPYEITILPNGSGDTTFNYVLIFIFLVIAIAGAVLWTILDYRRPHYEKLWYWFVILLRYYLGIVLLSYGFVKVVQTQFPPPSIDTLFQRYGESTPMRLLWTFMGYSKFYNLFIGLAEIGSGLLLFFRRTTLIGALLCIAVMSNVVVLNFCYDVPVKLFSSHLLMIAFILVLPHVERLMAFFILNKPVAPASWQAVYQRPQQKKVYIAVKTMIVGSFLASYIFQSVMAYQSLDRHSERPVLFGIYDVQEFILEGDTLRPLLTDTKRWSRMIINKPGLVTIQYMDGASIHWRLKTDTLKHTLEVSSMGSSVNYQYTYQINHDAMIMTGGEPETTVTFLMKGAEKFPLLNGGFNWVNEYPANR